MNLALILGQRGQGKTWPNPSVGCVIVASGRVVGRGWTQPGGRPHAEPVALAQAGIATRGATAYVTLEPCAHIGKTGPCSLALIDAGIARCVIGCTDSDDRVAGRGIAMLRDAGIDVVVGCQQGAAEQAHHGFFSRITQGRPRVTLKLALSLDGRIATRTGHSQWITGPMARRYVHKLRMTHDAVMVGGGTARDDDPTLTIRDMGYVCQPVRVIVSSQADFAGKALRSTVDQGPIWICHDAGAKVSNWADVASMLPVASVDGKLDPHAIVESLGKQGLTSVLCEGGGQLAASLLKAGLVDDLMIFTAGLAIGGDGRAGLGNLQIDTLDQADRFSLVNTQVIGDDILHHWRKSPAP